MKGRKLLSISGAVVITLTGGAAAATGNLMAPPPEKPPVDQKADAGTASVPLQKSEAKKDLQKKDAAKQ